jgi:hypothetical protein
VFDGGLPEEAVYGLVLAAAAQNDAELLERYWGCLAGDRLSTNDRGRLLAAVERMAGCEHAKGWLQNPSQQAGASPAVRLFRWLS